ncbi:MAG: hypothetical protein JW900_08885 [Anaerolineae bacterium]|nr:hypothetical protein [Anaerolineae bacterium]
MSSRHAGSRSLKALLTGYLRGFGLYIVVSVSALCLLAALAGVGALLVPLLDDLVDNAELWVMIGVLILWATLSFSVTLLIVVVTLVRRARQLDAAFAPLGLPGKLYLSNGRQYHGTVAGRRVDAYFHRGPILEVYVEAPFRTRVSIGTRDSLARSVGRLVQRQPLAADNPDFAHLDVYALDERWAQDLLYQPQARAALLRLTASSGSRDIRQVIVAPESIAFYLRYARVDEVSPEHVQQWMDDLLALVRVAENLPAPTQTAEATRLERKGRTERSSFFLPVLLGVLGLAGVLACFSLVIALVLIRLQ